MHPSTAWDDRLAAAARARTAALAQVGEPSPDILAPLIGPALTGGPEWPCRPAWRIVRRPGSLVLASDGLSNPWADRPGPGYGLEVFMDTPEQIFAAGDDPLRTVAGTWLFSAVAEISNVIAGHGGVRPLLEELGTVSVEVDGKRFPEHLRNREGRVGVLLGVAAKGFPDRIQYDNGDALLVAITVLTVAELKCVVAGGDETRRLLAERIAASDSGHLTVLDRVSINLR